MIARGANMWRPPGEGQENCCVRASPVGLVVRCNRGGVDFSEVAPTVSFNDVRRETAASARSRPGLPPANAPDL